MSSTRSASGSEECAANPSSQTTADGQVQRVRDVGQAEIVDEAQQHHLAVCRRQLCDDSRQVGRSRRLGSGELVHQIGHVDHRPAPPQAVEAQVPDDRVEERAQARRQRFGSLASR
jgi:hypothetical protein